jgi:phosphoenolpyruvate carboxykinase (GTP)
MLPFCGYNMGDYFGHWLEIGQTAAERGDAAKLPKLFWVNWFRKGDDGSFLWPGFGDNARVLKWVLERVAGTGVAVDTPIGRVPTAEAIDVSGLDLDPAVLELLTTVDAEGWRQELPQLEEHYASVGERLPQALKDQLAALEKRLAG